jgi:hypothetical protein
MLALAALAGALYLGSCLCGENLAAGFAVLFAEARRSDELGRDLGATLRRAALKAEVAQALRARRVSVRDAVARFRQAHLLDPEGAWSPCPTDEELVQCLRCWVSAVPPRNSPERGTVPAWLDEELSKYLRRGNTVRRYPVPPIRH